MNEDFFNRYFIGERLKNQLKEKEKERLILLDNNAEEFWKLGITLEKERNKLRADLKPNFLKEKEELEKERNRLLKAKTEEIKQLKEERKVLLAVKTQEARKIRTDRIVIRKDFFLKTQHIRDSRKEQLKSDLKLSTNLKEKREVWENHRKARQKFHDYWESLKKQYGTQRSAELEE